MKNKGFTLIELLAVIVILAIIALIATPIILGIINDSKKQSEQRSMELYGKAIQNAVAQAQLDGSEISAGDLSSDFLSGINYEGSRVVCTTNKLYSDGTIYLAGCTVNGNQVDYTYGEAKIVSIYRNTTDTVNIGDTLAAFTSGYETEETKENISTVIYLKHDIKGDKVVASYACMKYTENNENKEACINGAEGEYGEYDGISHTTLSDVSSLNPTKNIKVISETMNYFLGNNGSCYFSFSMSYCYDSSLQLLASPTWGPDVVAYDASSDFSCSADREGGSYCD